MKIYRGLLLCLACILGGPIYADETEECRFYTYKAKVVQVVDGETIDVDVDLGFHIELRNERFRLYGIDAPELRSYGGRKVSEEEKARGKFVKAELEQMVAENPSEVVICSVKDRRDKSKKGKFGRYLVILFIAELNVNAWMLEQGYAKADENAPRLFSEEKRRVLFDENGFNLDNVSQ